MYAVMISVLVAVGVFFGFNKGLDVNVWWSVVWAILGFFASMVGIGLIIRKRVGALMTQMQLLMADGQKKLQARVAMFQRKPSGDVKRMMAEMEKMQKSILTDALEFTKNLEPYRLWTPLFGRQIATSRMQLYYQMQDFAKADELMPKIIVVDPMTCAMKLSRMYTNRAPMKDIEKAFKKGVARVRYNQSALLYSLMAWIYIKNDMIQEAHNTLMKACENNENETLKKNRDRVANNKLKEFSNAGLGDEWYALFLEQPKVRMQRQQMRPDGRPF